MYILNDMASLAVRENNTKRKYLIVNRTQGKHIPVSPQKILEVCEGLSKLIRNSYRDEKLLIVGFAETATAIGAALAVNLGTHYIQTTRESLPDVSWIYFTEAHSHATEQKLVYEDIASAVHNVDRIIFAEDEITTGNTIMKIVEIIDREFNGEVKFSAVSLLNGMNVEALQKYEKRNIDIHYLIKTDHDGYDEIAEHCKPDGDYIPENRSKPLNTPKLLSITGALDTRRISDSADYLRACSELTEKLLNSGVIQGKRILVLGTEEFMFPAIFVGAQLEKSGYEVKTHSTTRSPISVCDDYEYPLHRRYELSSFYDAGRRTYIYDLKSYDTTVVITNSENPAVEGINSLTNALQLCENENITIVQWVKKV